MFRFAILRTAILSLSVSLSAAPEAADQVISLASGMIATHHSVSATPKGAVLLIHGWAAHMDEVGEMYKRLADDLAHAGYASLRINIRGESERERTSYRLTSTFSSRVTDAQTGLDFLHQTYPKLPIGVVGFSLGGSTSLALTGSNPTAISSLVLWSSAGNPSDILTSGMSPAIIKQALEEGEAKYPAWVELTVTREHLLGMLGYDVFTLMQDYRGALLSIRGSEDFVQPIESELFRHAAASPEEFHLLSGADHIFQAVDPDSLYDDRAIQITLEWLQETLH